MHPRNRHSGSYDFAALVRCHPPLAEFVRKNPHGGSQPTIDFANPVAVKALNRALLALYYGVQQWDIPAGYLCPPIPGRADYVHNVADLLASQNGGAIPRGEKVRVLDVGVGANCVYPIIGHGEYGWYFVGADVDPVTLESAKRILAANKALAEAVSLRLQPSASNVFRGVILKEDRFDLTVCNPPFHSSLAEAREGSKRKWRNLKLAPKLNFGGQGAELWCPGGELAFIRKMIEESVDYRAQVGWFTTLVSKESNLGAIYQALKKIGVADSKTFEMSHGQKMSRVVAWTFSCASSPG